MAATAITNTVLTRNTAADMPATAACAANEGALVTFDKADQKILLILENAGNTAAVTAVLEKGNGLQGVADQEITIATASKKVITIESGKYVDVSGDNKGKMLITDKLTTGTFLQVAAVVLP